jgi:hypothetical protein
MFKLQKTLGDYQDQTKKSAISYFNLLPNLTMMSPFPLQQKSFAQLAGF